MSKVPQELVQTLLSFSLCCLSAAPLVAQSLEKSVVFSKFGTTKISADLAHLPVIITVIIILLIIITFDEWIILLRDCTCSHNRCKKNLLHDCCSDSQHWSALQFAQIVLCDNEAGVLQDGCCPLLHCKFRCCCPWTHGIAMWYGVLGRYFRQFAQKLGGRRCVEEKYTRGICCGSLTFFLEEAEDGRDG